jgi:hypothetical protein
MHTIAQDNFNILGCCSCVVSLVTPNLVEKKYYTHWIQPSVFEWKEMNYHKMDTTICSNLDVLSPDFEFEPRVRFLGDSVLINLGILVSINCWIQLVLSLPYQNFCNKLINLLVLSLLYQNFQVYYLLFVFVLHSFLFLIIGEILVIGVVFVVVGDYIYDYNY